MKYPVSCFIKTAVLTAISIFMLLAHAFSDVTVPHVFGDHMVFQRDIMLPVWGEGVPGGKVTVSVDGNSNSTVTGSDGNWKTHLTAMAAGGPYELTIEGVNKIVFKNVMVGDVWLCSGQSNMWWPMKNLKDIPHNKVPVENSALRLFSIWSPEHDLYGVQPEWSSCTPENLSEFSAVAYYFGREIQHETGVTVGLIHSSMGGSVPETWMTRQTLISDPDFRPVVDYWDSITTVYSDAKKEFASYLEALALAKSGDAPEPLKPDMPFVQRPLRFYMRYPQGIYDAQLAPLIPFAIKGVIWYQGESSIERAWQYRKLFPAMISEWRHLWDQGDFPFIYVQLANYRGGASVPELREAQLMTLSLPKTGMAVTIDIGDSTNVHANNKWDVGRRLALSAFHVAYGRDIPYSGPLYTSMCTDGSSISIGFSHAEGGLVAGNGEQVKGFEIAGKDRVFHKAEARIDDLKVIVSSTDVIEPVAVRYAWKSNPTCNLYNTAGLPASPFRTDDWEGLTYGRLSP